MNHLNELIALELGWRDLRPAMANVGRGQSTGIPPGELRTYVPNWAGSLDLMHELENRFSKDDMPEYIKALLRIVAPGPDPKNWGYGVHATAEQKALAWLKVKGVKP